MSIKKRHRPDCTGGACTCPWRLDYRPEGTRGKQRRLLFPTKKTAQDYEATHRVSAKRGEYRDPKSVPTFSAVAQQWLDDKRGLHPATLLEARTNLKHLSVLDALRLDLINVPRVEKLRDDLLAKGELGPPTVARVMGVLSAVFKVAMRKGFVTANPGAVALRPRRPVTEVDDAHELETGALRPDEVLSSDEIARLIEHADGMWKVYIATAAATGMRSEEINALQWADFELETGRLFVRRSLSWTRDADQVGKVRPRFWPTKTKAGNREIPLAPELVSLLRTWKLKCPPSKSDLVFTESGLPLRRSRVLAGGLHPACRRAGLRRANVKTLRHSFASGLLAQGTPITVVQGLMGHANAGVTLKTYSHFIKGTDSGEAQRFAASFLGGTASRRARAALSDV